MCRLVGIAGPSQQSELPSFRHLVGAPHSLRVQADHGNTIDPANPGHRDSWGIAWIDADGEPAILRETGSATDSASYVFAAETACRSNAVTGPGNVLIGHLRKAVAGEITTENAHPFRVETSAGTMFFAHNGHVRESLLESLRSDLRLAGDNIGANADCDSQVLGHWIGQRIDKTAPGLGIPESLRELLRRGAELPDPYEAYTGLVLLMVVPDALYVLRHFGRYESYYTLYHRNDGPHAVVASERTADSDDWQLLEKGVLWRYPADGTTPQSWNVMG
jgi:predicted glutamine amidotransferase